MKYILLPGEIKSTCYNVVFQGEYVILFSVIYMNHISFSTVLS